MSVRRPRAACSRRRCASGIVGSYRGQRLQHACGAELTRCAPVGAAARSSDALAQTAPLLDLLQRATTACTRVCFNPEESSHASTYPSIITTTHDHDHDARASRIPASFDAAATRRSTATTAARVHGRHRRAGGQRQDGAAARALPPLRDDYSLAVVTNDIFTKEDGEFLVRQQRARGRANRAVETGGCPHAADSRRRQPEPRRAGTADGRFQPELLFVESGGDNLAAQFSRELADYTIYVIDVSGGDKIPRKGGPGITQSDLLVINKTDLAPLVGADLGVMARDARGCAATGRSCSRR